MKKFRSKPELLPLTRQTMPVIELADATEGDTENIQDEIRRKKRIRTTLDVSSVL